MSYMVSNSASTFSYIGRAISLAFFEVILSNIQSNFFFTFSLPIFGAFSVMK